MKFLSSTFAVIAGAAILTSGCQEGSRLGRPREDETARRGRETIAHYGCGSCHTIPGIRGADAMVGPPLEHIASRTYIAGVLQNTHQNLFTWLKNPPGVDAKTAMPNLHLSDAEAADVAAYLYTLR
jgi:cytochrome c1